MRRSLNAALTSALALAGCGLDGAAPEWVAEDAAVVRCALAGAHYELPPLSREVPAPDQPTGFYARVLDGKALDDLGYARDTVACASLHVPDPEQVELARKAIKEVHEARAAVDLALRKVDCACEAALVLDKRSLIHECRDQSVDHSCSPSQGELDHVEQVLAPLEEKLAALHMPRVHWRLSGITDRRGRFLALRSKLFPRHRGGSDAYFPGMEHEHAKLPAHVSALLEQEGVVAVVRQDGGRAHLVVRELSGDRLVLDHIAYPDVGPDGHGLIGELDARHPADFVDLLSKPEARRELLLAPKDGTVVEVDRVGLAGVDRAIAVGSTLGYGSDVTRSEEPEALVDRVAFQVPFGTEGKQLKVRAKLSAAGQVWARTAQAHSAFAAAFIDMTEREEPVPQAPKTERNFLLWGQPWESTLFFSAVGAVAVLRSIEEAAPGTVKGGVDGFSADFPTGPLPEDFDTAPGLKMLRQRLSVHPYALAGTLNAEADTVDLTLTPR